MITVESLLYKLDLKLNKLASLANQFIPTENKILAIQEAEIKIVKQKLGPLNNLQLGFEGNNKRYADLQFLVESSHDHSLPLELADTVLNKWRTDISKLVPKYMFFVDGYVLADKGNCKNVPIYLNGGLTKHGDVNSLLNNSNYKPSFEWQETFPTMSGDFLEIYTDGTFTPINVNVSYIRYPKKVDIEGYITLGGEDSVNQPSEMPEHMEDEILNIAVQEIAMNTENIPAVQLSAERIKSQE